MVKKGYRGNDSLSLAWNHLEVFQINPFYTTSSALSTSPLHVSTCHQETQKSFPHISQFGCEIFFSLLGSEALIAKIYFTKILSSTQALERLSVSADYWFCRLTFSIRKLNCSMLGFPYCRENGGEYLHQLKVCSFSTTRKNASHQFFLPN